MKKIFNEIQLQFIKNNYNNITYKEMSKLELFTGLTDKQIRTKAATMGLRKQRQFNKQYFKSINDSNKAYWLGFIYADGYITYSNELGIELQYSDKEHLEKLNELIGGVHKVTRRKRNQKFNGYGCIHINKKNRVVVSFTNSNVEFLNYISDEVYRQIGVRGHIYKEKELKYRLQYLKKSDTKKLLDKIYEDKLCCKLDRKYDKYNVI